MYLGVYEVVNPLLSSISRVASIYRPALEELSSFRELMPWGGGDLLAGGVAGCGLDDGFDVGDALDRVAVVGVLDGGGGTMALPTAGVGAGVIRVWERDISWEVNYFPITLGGGDRRGHGEFFALGWNCARDMKNWRPNFWYSTLRRPCPFN
jgi:hypothetical protein